MSDPGDTATRYEEKKCRKALVRRRIHGGGRARVIQDKQVRRRRTKGQKIIGSILHERPVVKKKFVDIKQCEARSSKQRLKGRQIPRGRQRKNIVTKNDGHTPKNTKLGRVIACSHPLTERCIHKYVFVTQTQCSPPCVSTLDCSSTV